MQQSMKSGFIEAAGVDPDKMKILVLVIVVAVFLSIGAWIGSQILGGYTEGESEAPEVFESTIRLLLIFIIAITFVTYF